MNIALSVILMVIVFGVPSVSVVFVTVLVVLELLDPLVVVVAAADVVKLYVPVVLQFPAWSQLVTL